MMLPEAKEGEDSRSPMNCHSNWANAAKYYLWIFIGVLKTHLLWLQFCIPFVFAFGVF